MPKSLPSSTPPLEAGRTLRSKLGITAEAALAAAAGSLIRLLVPLRVWTTRLEGSPHQRRPLNPAEHAEIERINNALDAVGRRFSPFKNCLVQSIAALIMLKRRGMPGSLHLGVLTARDGNGLRIVSHSWVDVDGQVIGTRSEGLTEIYTGKEQPR